MSEPLPPLPRRAGPPDAYAGARRFAHGAMATRFEILIAGVEAEYARQAADAAFAEVDRLERELSRFRSGSDVSRINRLQAGESVRVGLDTIGCLRLAARVSEETRGAFDVTVGPLMTCWRGEDGLPREPSAAELADARARTGMHLVIIDEDEHAVAVKARGVEVDLGGIGKGWALDRAAALLAEWSIGSALLQAGQSSALALAAPPGAGEGGWPVSLRAPGGRAASTGVVHLRGRALSGSAMPGPAPHIFDPRTGRPAAGNLAAWAAAPSAALSDALSTAFLVMPPDEVRDYCGRHPEVSAMLVLSGEAKRGALRFGTWGE